MTKNQIDYQRLKEDIRHNVASEGVGMKQAEASMASAGAAYFNATVQQDWYNTQAAIRQAEITAEYAKMGKDVVMPFVKSAAESATQGAAGASYYDTGYVDAETGDRIWQKM